MYFFVSFTLLVEKFVLVYLNCLAVIGKVSVCVLIVLFGPGIAGRIDRNMQVRQESSPIVIQHAHRRYISKFEPSSKAGYTSFDL